MSNVVNMLDVQVSLPAFLENSDEDILNHRQLAAKMLKNVQDLYDKLISDCENELELGGNFRCRPTEYTQSETELKKLERDCDAQKNKVFKLDQCLKSYETDLKSLRRQNEKIQDEILQLSENLDKLAVQEEQLAKEKKETTETMEQTWKSYVMAKNYYKKNLQCHIRLHEPAEATEEGASSDLQEVLTFSYLIGDNTVLEAKLSRKNNIWKMLDVKPFVPLSVQAQKDLHETNDIRGFISYLWEEAVKLSSK